MPAPKRKCSRTRNDDAAWEAFREADDVYQKKRLKDMKMVEAAVSIEQIVYAPPAPSKLRLTLEPPSSLPDIRIGSRCVGGWEISAHLEPHTHFKVTERRSEAYARELFEGLTTALERGAFHILFEADFPYVSVTEGWLADPLRVMQFELRHILDRNVFELIERLPIILHGGDSNILEQFAAALIFNLHGRGLVPNGVRPFGPDLHTRLAAELGRLARELPTTPSPALIETGREQLPELERGRLRDREKNTLLVIDSDALTGRDARKSPTALESAAERAAVLQPPILILAPKSNPPKEWGSRAEALLVEIKDRYFYLEHAKRGAHGGPITDKHPVGSWAYNGHVTFNLAPRRGWKED